MNEVLVFILTLLWMFGLPLICAVVEHRKNESWAWGVFVVGFTTPFILAAWSAP